jgi:DNA-binding XRE family transcriptional regulator
MSIHSRIKERRMARKMSRSELAEAVGVSWQSVQLWETEGKTAPKEQAICCRQSAGLHGGISYQWDA